jgi:hypothetical protein
LETDEQIVERLRTTLEFEPSEEEEEAAEDRPQPQIPAEDDIAARLSAFKRRTEFLLDNARRTVGSARGSVDQDG